MLFLRLLGVKMADTDLPKNWEGAARWFLGGTIVFASGFEAVVLFWEGKFAAASGSFGFAIALMAILIYWDRLKSKMPRVMAALTAAAIDARLWAILLLALAAFAGIPNLQGAGATWIYALPLFIGLALFLAAWGYLGPPKEQKEVGGAATAASTQATPQIDGQTKLDLVHLLNFGVRQTTALMLEHLIQLAASPEVTDAFKSGEDSDAAMESKKWFIGHVSGKLGGGTDRIMRFNSLMRETEGEAERTLEAIPQDQRPGGDQLKLRRQAIANLQFKRAVQFLKHEKRDVEENLISQRHNLIEHLTARER